MIEVADVCSGLGNFSFGLEATGLFKTSSFCETDPHCREWLGQQWPGVPIHSDLRTLNGKQLGSIDVLVGGIPCQPASLAGRRAGSADGRWLWPDFLRLAAEALPLWIVAENPLGIVTVRPHGLEWIHESLEATGYEVLPIALGADDCGAPHIRKRTWIIARLADAHGGGRGAIRRQGIDRVREEGILPASGDDLADTDSGRWEGFGLTQFAGFEGAPRNESHRRDGAPAVGDAAGAGQPNVQGGSEYAGAPRGRTAIAPSLPNRWPARRGEPQHDWEPARVFEVTAPPISVLGGLPDGSSTRLGLRLNRSRLKALGNGITPKIPYEIGLAIARCEGLI